MHDDVGTDAKTMTRAAMCLWAADEMHASAYEALQRAHELSADERDLRARYLRAAAAYLRDATEFMCEAEAVEGTDEDEPESDEPSET